jgi:hypothetical protein
MLYSIGSSVTLGGGLFFCNPGAGKLLCIRPNRIHPRLLSSMTLCIRLFPIGSSVMLGGLLLSLVRV